MYMASCSGHIYARPSLCSNIFLGEVALHETKNFLQVVTRMLNSLVVACNIRVVEGAARNDY